MTDDMNAELSRRLTYLSLLLKVSKDWKAVGEIVSAAQDEESAAQELAKYLGTDKVTAEVALNMQFRSLVAGRVSVVESDVRLLTSRLDEHPADEA